MKDKAINLIFILIKSTYFAGNFFSNGNSVQLEICIIYASHKMLYFKTKIKSNFELGKFGQ